MKKRSSTWIFIALVTSFPLLAYTGYHMMERRFMRLPVFGREEIVDGRKVAHKIEDFILIDQNGNEYNSEEWKNRVVVADFFFTSCGTICPKMTASLKKVQEAFDGDEVLINSFTVDPERDNPERLSWYASRFNIRGENWKLLTGEKRDIYRMARNSFMVVATDGDGGPDDFIHSEKLVLIDKQGRIRGNYDGTENSDVKKLVADIKKLNNEK